MSKLCVSSESSESDDDSEADDEIEYQAGPNLLPAMSSQDEDVSSQAYHRQCSSLWDAKMGTEIFHATMSLENIHMISMIIHFDNWENKPAPKQKDKLAAIGTVWDKWVHRFPLLYNLGPNGFLKARSPIF